MTSVRQDTPPPTATPTVLTLERDRAERLLNAVRLIVLMLLGVAALAYAPTLTPTLVRVNFAVLLPTLTWTILQYRLFYERPLLPRWLTFVNPIVDITAVTVILAGYGFAQSSALALKTPMFAAYFMILAALPVASSTRKAAAVSTLVLIEYTLLVLAFALTGRLDLVTSPLAASVTPSISLLDEGAKLLMLACAGVVATYATRWQERVTTRYAQATRESAQLQSRLAHAQLQALKLQLHPHFLFNTLNTITALVHTDPAGAERMVNGLSELLRISLGSVGEEEVPLERELEVLEHYLDIQQVRFADRLSVKYRIAADTERALVPNLLLQPLVENAIKHGIGPRRAAGCVQIFAQRRNGVLVLEVSDDGVGERSPEARREGVGLANSRTRLRSLYGDAQRFDAGPRESGGFRVYIEIPWHTEPVVPRGEQSAATRAGA